MMRAGILFALAATTYAQVGAPQLGLIPDGASLRPVAGIPASAVVGSALTFNRNLSQSVTAASFSLAVDADSGEVLLVTDTANPIANVRRKPDNIRLSPRGSAALLWYPAIRHAQILSGLPSSPTVREVDLSYTASEPTALSVSDDGASLAGIWSGVPVEISPIGVAALPGDSPALALAYAPGSSDLALVSANKAILWNTAGTSVLASFANPVQPIAAALDSRRLVVADASGAILTVDFASGSLSTFDCQCAPQGLFPMSRAVYRVTSLSQGAFKLFDADQGAIWFAPLALPVQASGANQ